MTHYAYSNNGNSWRCVKTDWSIEAGEVLFDHQPTEDELNVAFPDRAGSFLADAKAKAIFDLNQQAQGIADHLTAGYPEFEKLTWEDQRREALAWEADNTAPTPYIDVLAAERGIDRADYLARTLAKTKAFAAAAQKLVGQRQKFEDQIKAAANAEALAAINVVFNLG